MGVAIQCILEMELAVNAHMEGKSLAMAYCGESDGGDPADANEKESKVIVVDFGGPNSSPVPPPSIDSGTLLSPLDGFIAETTSNRWHDPAAGLAAVRGILQQIRNGAKVSLGSDFDFLHHEDEGDEDLTAGVRYDLEQLEKILIAAEKAKVRFHLAVDG